MLDRDVSRASALAVRVFREVFSIQDELQLRVLDEEGAQASDAPEEDICERCGEYGAGRRQRPRQTKRGARSRTRLCARKNEIATDGHGEE